MASQSDGACSTECHALYQSLAIGSRSHGVIVERVALAAIMAPVGARCDVDHPVLRMQLMRPQPTVSEQECTRCHLTKPASDFYYVPTAAKGLKKQCKACMLVRMQATSCRPLTILPSVSDSTQSPDRTRAHTGSAAASRHKMQRHVQS